MSNKMTGNEPAMSMCNELGNIYSHGLTIRQHFAAMAMQGLLATGRTDTVEQAAVLFADGLIEELNKP